MIPIILTAYNRLDSLKRTIESLSNCYYFDKDDLTVYLDGGKNQKDWQIIYKVYEYLSLAKIKVDEMVSKNLGLRENSLRAINTALLKHDKIIFVQDDMQFSRDFLQFMDWALNEFENRKDIMFVTGYSHIEQPTCYLTTLLAGGLGIWRDKYSEKYNLYPNYKIFARHTAPLFANNLRNILEGKSDAFMALLCYAMHFKHARCLHPNGNKVKYLVSDSTNSSKRDAKKFNRLLYTGFSKVLTENNDAQIQIRNSKTYKWSILKRFTRWIVRKFTGA